MSIELDWAKLDASLAAKLVDALNRSVENLTRPSFIGPVTVTSLDFGTVAPDIEIIDVRDIYRDFLDGGDNDAPEGLGSEASGHPVGFNESMEDDDYEWISRRAAPPATPAPSYHPFPPHLRYTPSPSIDSHTFFAGVPVAGIHSPTTAEAWQQSQLTQQLVDPSGPTVEIPTSITDHARSQPAAASTVPNENPDLQFHFFVRHKSDMRITITTSLLINYPSPMFMALPIKLSVTGLVFEGQVVAAYEGSRKRVHICIVDELDPYGPATDRRRPSDGTTTADETRTRDDKPLPIGQRLLPSIDIESEIGQADKHVLRNVTRVEKFMQEVIRKTVEDELVFPNFHTLLMGDGSE